MEYWICLWSILGVVLCLPKVPYVVYQITANFDKAVELCKRDGFLTNMASLEELQKILSIISDKQTTAGEFNYWIGLKKGEDCVVSHLPLRGFKWTVDNSSTSEVARWRKEPPLTCTGIRCALFSGDYNGTAIVSWGFKAKSCEGMNPFICKLEKGKGGGERHVVGPCPTPHITEALSLRPVPDDPHKLLLKCASGDYELICSKLTQQWEHAGSPVDNSICQVSGCPTGYSMDDSRKCVEDDKCSERPCQNVCVKTSGSFVCKCSDQHGKLHDEGSLACREGSTPSSTVEGSENHGIPDYTQTPKSAIPTKPSLTSSSDPPTSPADDVRIEDNSADRANIFIPVLIAVMCLVVVVVVVLAVVKCCLRRRSQKLSMKNAEKMAMKRVEASKQAELKGQDSMEHTNEKEVI